MPTGTTAESVEDPNGDSRLMSAAMSDSPGAFDSLRLRYLKRVYRACWCMLGSVQEAEDATQETFVRAYLHRRTFKPGFAFSPWLMRIARNVCIDHLRAHEPLECWDAEILTRIPETSPSPEHALMNTEVRQALRECLSRLNAQDRAVLNGFYLSEEQVRETIVDGLREWLKLSRRTIYKRHLKALERLKHCLGMKGVIEF